MVDWGSPPEFGSKGQPPPLTSKMSLAREAFFLNARKYKEAVGAVSTLAYLDEPSDEMKPAHDWLWSKKGSDSLRYAEKPAARERRPSSLRARSTPVFSLRIIRKDSFSDTDFPIDVNKYFSQRFMEVYGDVEIRRIRHYRYWKRKDPVAQLIPGSTTRVKVSTTLGLSSSAATELSSSLGIQGGLPNVVGLSGQITRRLGETFNLELQYQEEQELTLTNDKPGYNRLVAIWHPVQRLDVDVLRVKTSGLLVARLSITGSRLRHRYPTWLSIASVPFTDNFSIQLTSADVAVRR